MPRPAGRPNRVTEQRALEAERELLQARMERRPLAKEVLDNLMSIFMNIAKRYQPREGEEDPEKLNQFERWAIHARDTAKALAPFQSPTMKSIVVQPDEITKMGKVTRFPLAIFNSKRQPVLIEHDPSRNGGSEPVLLDLEVEDDDDGGEG